MSPKAEKSHSRCSKKENFQDPQSSTSSLILTTCLQQIGYLSSTTANLLSLSKLVDPEMFRMILHTGVCPLVQLNILDRFLDPNRDPDVDTLTESICKKIAHDLLPKPNHAALARETDNGPTRLLCAALWLKLNHMFFNQGMQKEACRMFMVWEKQLSRLLMGAQVYG